MARSGEPSVLTVEDGGALAIGKMANHCLLAGFAGNYLNCGGIFIRSDYPFFDAAGDFFDGGGAAERSNISVEDLRRR